MQVILAVTDLERSLAFYEAAFDWPRNDYANYVELHPPDGGTLGLYERDGFAGTWARSRGRSTTAKSHGRMCTFAPTTSSRPRLASRQQAGAH